MQNLDYRVIQQAIDWLEQGHTIWLCTVLSTFGSSPREPGAMMVAKADGAHVGSLSGGCVEEDFLDRLVQGEYTLPSVVIRYGGASQDNGNPRVKLPCGGVLEVLVEKRSPETHFIGQLRTLLQGLSNGEALEREVGLAHGNTSLHSAHDHGSRVIWEQGSEIIKIVIAPVARLILAGYSTVADACAQFALSLGYEVVICDPREDITSTLNLPEGVEFISQLPSVYLVKDGACTPSTAVVATTHDPRIDDLAMMAAVKTPAGYIGVMGSMRTSEARAERLRRSGGLTEAEIQRIHMPVGLDIGSKTPAEIALSIMADVVRARRQLFRAVS
ncbi:XdhC family protein [Marinobacter hydrocarbonoclasticus]|uniref:XdhC family protein n=1 Tax=Marinobacter nauticus TaxID=2743 RepID=UPI001C977D2C|nr:XdhC family protein [Marinobacter nauticus]MBY6194141.1 XdhC family protein [Marinobacter nauticus]MBY6215288.1 XdhC family protein [Marinobacter nauticus]